MLSGMPPTKRPAPAAPRPSAPGRPRHSGQWCRAILKALASAPVVPLHTLYPEGAVRSVRVACRRAAGELERSGLCRLAWRRLPGRTKPAACAVRPGTPGAGVLETAGRRPPAGLAGVKLLPRRLTALALLGGGPLPLSDFASRLGLSYDRAINLARRLRREGLAVGQRSGKHTVLSLAPDAAAGGWIDLGRGFRLRLAPTGTPGPPSPTTRRQRAWTPEEDALLGELTDGEVAARTGRTAWAAQARRLKLHKLALRRDTTGRG
jgi:hypothetical protein